MQEGPERAWLAIADVSGYTGDLAGVELDHAQDTLADPIGTVFTAMAPFELSKLEGDAAFMSFAGETVDGSALRDTTEGTYIAHRWQEQRATFESRRRMLTDLQAEAPSDGKVPPEYAGRHLREPVTVS